MSRNHVDRIAEAVLYEGYILYPYRASVKNRQRWTFGGLYPEACCEARADGSSSSCQTECLVEGSDATVFEASVRFLHLTARQAAQLITPSAEWPEHGGLPYHTVDSFRVGDHLYQTWQEAVERSVPLGTVTLGDLVAMRCWASFEFPGGRQVEPVRDPAGDVVGLLIREQRAISGIVEASAERVGEWLYRITLRVINSATVPAAMAHDRDECVLRAFASTHAVLNVGAGRFVSLMDPPLYAEHAAAGCRNLGTWPVLVGEEGEANTMLSSPIVLYDYPQVAPESAGDFFDGTEIDEMLTLRIMTLTDDEKAAMAAVDERASALLARTEALARDQLLGLHGTIRDLRGLSEENANA